MFISFRLFTYFIVILWSFVDVSTSLQCLDENGKSVDWFVVYKLPEITHESSLISNGSAYMYITSKTLINGWTLSQQPISSQRSLVANTLKPFLYDKNNDSLWLIYNDQNGSISSENFGHTKGVVGANTKEGFWLIHSVPNFPSFHSKYSFPETGHKNGQSMLCMSLLQDQIDLLGNIFLYNKPKFLEKKISANIKSLYPNLISAAKGATIKKAPWEMSSDILSAGGRRFTNFAKAAKFNKDLYEWVAAEFKTNIFTETWQNEVHPLPSECGNFQVINIQSIDFQNLSHSAISFSSHKDHSKWAISETVSKPWICIGDINRAEPQEKRGGGTMCLEDEVLWKAYHNIIGETSDCKFHKNKRTNNHI